MSKDTRSIILAIAFATGLLVLLDGALYRATVAEVREHDGHVAAALHDHDDRFVEH